MADLGFLPAVRRLLSRTPAGGQRMLFSATLDKAIDVLVRQFLNQPKTHQADSAQATIATMSHHVLHVRREQRIPVLVDLTSAPGRKVVFTRTKHGAKALARQLNRSGIPTVDLHGNLSQGARTRNMEAFHSGTRHHARRDRRRRPRHPRRRRGARRARRPAVRAQGLPAPLRPHGPRRCRGHRRHVDDRRAGPRGPRADPRGRHPGDHDQGRRALPTRCCAASLRVPGRCPAGFARLAPAAQATPRRKPKPRRGPVVGAEAGRPQRQARPSRWPQPGPTSRTGWRDRSGQVRAVPSAQRGVVQLADSLTSRSRALVHHVRVARGVREAQLLVEVHRGRVVRLDVEQDVLEAQGAQVVQADADQHPPEAAALGRGVDRRRRTPRPASPSAAWSSGTRASGRRVDRDEQVVGVEPWLGHPLGELRRRPSNPARGGGRTPRR